MLELVELEVRELLQNYGYDSENTPVIKGSATLALKGDTSKYGTPSLQELLDAIDTYLEPPKRDYNAPFILPIDSVFTVPGRGTVACGTIKQGTVRKGSEAEILGFDEITKTILSDVQVMYCFLTECNEIANFTYWKQKFLDFPKKRSGSSSR